MVPNVPNGGHQSSSVLLHVYDITNTPYEQVNKGIKGLNSVTRQLQIGGMFHGGIEINGQEWSFGYCPTGTGVYCCRPTSNPMYSYRETLDLGSTSLTPSEIQELVRRLKVAWPGNSYDLLNRNCCHFCDELSQALRVTPVPAWLNRFAEASDATVTFFNGLWSNLKVIGNEIAVGVRGAATTSPPRLTPGQQLGIHPIPGGGDAPPYAGLHRPPSQPSLVGLAAATPPVVGNPVGGAPGANPFLAYGGAGRGSAGGTSAAANPNATTSISSSQPVPHPAPSSSTRASEGAAGIAPPENGFPQECVVSPSGLTSRLGQSRMFAALPTHSVSDLTGLAAQEEAAALGGARSDTAPPYTPPGSGSPVEGIPGHVGGQRV